MINFIIEGEAIGQGRPRFKRVGAGVRTYDPEKSMTYKNLVHFSALPHRPEKLLTGAISLHLTIHVPTPQSWSKKKKSFALLGTILPTTKPDCDNVAKGIADALNQIIYVDDKQISRLIVCKQYSERPLVGVMIHEWNGEYWA